MQTKTHWNHSICWFNRAGFLKL